MHVKLPSLRFVFISLQSERNMWWFWANIKKLRSFIKVSKNDRTKERSNGHKIQLNSNFVLALSIYDWPINHMSEVISLIEENLLLKYVRSINLLNSFDPWYRQRQWCLDRLQTDKFWIYRMQNQLLRGLCLLWRNVAQRRKRTRSTPMILYRTYM